MFNSFKNVLERFLNEMVKLLGRLKLKLKDF